MLIFVNFLQPSLQNYYPRKSLIFVYQILIFSELNATRIIFQNDKFFFIPPNMPLSRYRCLRYLSMPIETINWIEHPIETIDCKNTNLSRAQRESRSQLVSPRSANKEQVVKRTIYVSRQIQETYLGMNRYPM